MIFPRVTIGALLLSVTNTIAGASTISLRNLQETTLGAAFLAIAKNYSSSPATRNEAKRVSFSTSDVAVAAIGPLADAIDPLCEQYDGYVQESTSQVGNETGTTSYSVTCHFPMAEYNTFEDAVVALLGDYCYSYNFLSSSEYVDESINSRPAIYGSKQMALENLMVSANTIADLMLVFSAWQRL